MKLSTFIKQVKADYLVIRVPYVQYLCIQASYTEYELSKIHPKQTSHYVRLFVKTKKLIKARLDNYDTVFHYLSSINMPSDRANCHRFRIQMLDEFIYTLTKNGE